MLFNSQVFLVFILIFFCLYFSTQGKIRLILCCVASGVFYGWWSTKYLGLLYLVILGDYFFALLLEKLNRKRLLLWGAIAFNVLILCIFKYYNFFINEFIQLINYFNINCSLPVSHLLLPVGISFYIFQSTSYVIDVYRGNFQAEKSLLAFATYVSFFPQLVAGPIVRAPQLLPEIKKANASFDCDRILQGLQIVLYGYALKVVVADSIALYVDKVWHMPHGSAGTSLLLACFLFSVQIYCDFNGYSKIAIGLGKILGFDFGVNFNRPYFSRSFADFWRRWHISLSSWIRDYLYIPLGGSRRGPIRTYFNLLLTMMLCGLWHGANMTFVVWGTAHGVLLATERFFRLHKKNSSSRFPSNTLLSTHKNLTNFLSKFAQAISVSVHCVFVFGTVSLLWIFFRSDNIDQALLIFNKIFTIRHIDIIDFPLKFVVLKSILLCSVLAVSECVMEIRNSSILVKKFNFAYSLMLLLARAFLGTFQGETFIYFQF